MPDFTVSILGDRQLRGVIDRMLKDAPVVAGNAVNEYALLVQSQAKRNLTDLPAVDSGRLRNSIRIESFADGLARGVGTDLDYAKPVEMGSRPHFPPLEPIRQWCRRHSIPESAAYAIALKIAKNGQAPKPYLFPAFEQERPYFEATIKAAWMQLMK